MSLQLNEGDTDPALGKVVKFLVLQTEDFIVYLDPELEVQWHHTGNISSGNDFGSVLNRAAHLESSARFLRDRAMLQPIKRMIAEGIARYLEYSSLDLADQIHDIAEAQIRKLNRQTSWSWYFDAAYWLTLGCVLVWLMVWLLREQVSRCIGAIGTEVVLGALIGSAGAMISVISRGNRLDLDANAGKTIHVTEGIARIVVGVAGALLVALAYKGGVLFAGVKFSGSEFAVLLSLAIVAGASERLVPSLVAKIEGDAIQKKDPSARKRKG